VVSTRALAHLRWGAVPAGDSNKRQAAITNAPPRGPRCPPLGGKVIWLNRRRLLFHARLPAWASPCLGRAGAPGRRLRTVVLVVVTACWGGACRSMPRVAGTQLLPDRIDRPARESAGGLEGQGGLVPCAAWLSLPHRLRHHDDAGPAADGGPSMRIENPLSPSGAWRITRSSVTLAIPSVVLAVVFLRGIFPEANWSWPRLRRLPYPGPLNLVVPESAAAYEVITQPPRSSTPTWQSAADRQKGRSRPCLIARRPFLIFPRASRSG